MPRASTCQRCRRNASKSHQRLRTKRRSMLCTRPWVNFHVALTRSLCACSLSILCQKLASRSAAGGKGCLTQVPSPGRPVAMTPAWLAVFMASAALNCDRDRDLDAAEIFAGCCSIHKGFITEGFQSRPFDVCLDPTQDICSVLGFVTAVELLLRVKRGGLAWFAPQCSLWVWISSSVHKRSSTNNFYGDSNHAGTKQASMMGHLVAGLVRLCHSRGVFFILEQPRNSRLIKFPPIRKALKMTGAKVIVTWLKAFDDDFPIAKPIELHGTARFMPMLKRDQPNASGDHECYRKDFEGSVTGSSLLTHTQTYPKAFGVAVAQAFSRSRVKMLREAELLNACPVPCESLRWTKFH